MTKITAVAPSGECPLWHKFLARITPDDGELQDFLRRVAGYCLTGISREHALFFGYGTGANGKGTFLSTLTGSRRSLQGVPSGSRGAEPNCTSAELIEAAMTVDECGIELWPGLLEALKAVARDRRGDLNANTLGNWLRDHKDRVIEDLKLTHRGTTHRPSWTVGPPREWAL